MIKNEIRCFFYFKKEKDGIIDKKKIKPIMCKFNEFLKTFHSIHIQRLYIDPLLHLQLKVQIALWKHWILKKHQSPRIKSHLLFMFLAFPSISYFVFPLVSFFCFSLHFFVFLFIFSLRNRLNSFFKTKSKNIRDGFDFKKNK